MNIVTVIPNSFGYPTNSVGTDAVRRDNVAREAIPSISQGERGAAEKGIGNEGERNNQANLFQNPTYDRPTVSQAFANNLNGQAAKDNANEESAGKQNAESKQEQQQIEDGKRHDVGVEVPIDVASDAAQKEQSARSELAKERTANISTSKDIQADVPMADASMTKGDAGIQLLKAGLQISQQTQQTVAVISGFYSNVSAQSKSSLNFRV